MKSPTDDEKKQEPTISYRTPVYLQLREIVRNKIEEGEYPPGSAIPSENDLAGTYGISRITVRNAVDALVNEGILRRVQGKGVFVVGSKMEQAIEEFSGFIPSLAKSKNETSTREQAKVLRPAGDYFAGVFKLDPEDQLYYIRCIVNLESEPVSLEEIYVPYEVIPQLNVVNSSVFSISSVFEFYGVKVSMVRQSLEILECGSKIRHALDVPEGVAVMMLECLYHDESGSVIGYSRSYTRSDKINFKVNLRSLN